MMQRNQDVSNSLLSAVCQGRLETVRELINTFGLSYSKQWDKGYVLLCHALKYNHAAVAKLLLTSGSKVNSRSWNEYSSNTPLHFAAINGDIEIVEMLLEKNAKIDAKNPYGNTPLYNAITKKKLEVTELLLKHRADVNAREDDGVSPLLMAVGMGCSQSVDLLLKYGANVNCYSFAQWCFVGKNSSLSLYGETINPLHIAANKGYALIAENLLTHGACINSSTSSKGYTPLHLAASELDNEEVVKLFLKKGADINARSQNGKTPLHIATQTGHERVVKLLLQHGAKVDNEDKYGNTVLHIAVERRNLMIVEDVLKYCPDINNQSSRNSLKTAIYGYHEEYKKIVEALLEYGISIRPEDTNDPELLNTAVKRGHLKIVEGLLKYGADINVRYHIRNTPIFYAIKNADLKMTKLLLTNGAKVKDNPELLNMAVRKVCIEIVEVLLQHDVDVNSSDIYGRTALNLTAANENYDFEGSLIEDPGIIRGKTAKLLLSKGANVDSQTTDDIIRGKIAKLLLSKGANVDSQTVDGVVTTLHVASRNGYAKVVEVLLKKGVNVNIKTKEGTTALHIATQKCHLRIVKAFFEMQHDVDINAIDKYGRTALHFTALSENEYFFELIQNGVPYYGNEYNEDETDEDINIKLTIAKLLLSKGANINCRATSDITPLHLSANKRNEQFITMLLNNGANVNSKLKNGFTALHIATKKGHKAVVEVLLKYGARVDSKSESDITSLHLAAGRGSQEIIEILMKFGADINSKDKDGKTALLIGTSAKKRNEQFITLLLNNGANVNSKLKNGFTALHIATKKGHKAVVEVLLKYGARVDSKSESDITSLHLAAGRGSQEIIEILMKFGADINSKDKEGKTALHIASRKGHASIVIILLEYGSDINIMSRVDHTPLDSVKLGIDGNDCRGYDCCYGYYNHDEHTHILEEIANVLRCHIVKMKTASLYVSEKNLLSISGRDELKPFQCECEEEIARTKIEKINDTNIYFYDILTKGTRSLAAYMRNENIVKVLKSDYKTIFPIYSNMIKSNFKKGLKRKEVLEKCNEIVHFSFDNFHLPPICTEHIFSYLNEEELRNVTDAFKSPDSTGQ